MHSLCRDDYIQDPTHSTVATIHFQLLYTYLLMFNCFWSGWTTVFAEIFVVLISDVTFITKFKKLNNWRCRGQHAKLARLFQN